MTAARTEAVTYSLDQVAPRSIEWLWPGLIPRGKLTVLCGDPGLGKSFLTLDLAARVSRGGPWPDDERAAPCAPASAIVLNAEDDPADTIRPRLERMEGDLARVIALDCVRDAAGRFTEFVIGENIGELRRAILARGDVALVVIDPLSAYVGDTDSYNNAHVRAMLKPLSDLAAETGVAVVLVTHLRKSGEGSAVQRAMGSLAFTAAARVVLTVTRHQDDPELRVLACAKSNLAPDRVAHIYAVEDGRLVWLDRFEASADEVMAGERRPPGRQVSPAMAQFEAALRARLREEGPLAPAQVREMCERLGVSFDSVRAGATKRRLGVRTVRDGTDWRWELDGANESKGCGG